MSTANITEEDVAALRAITDVHEKACLAGDWAGWVATCTDDVVVLTQEHPPIEGCEAVLQWLESFPPVTEMTVTVQAVTGNGDMASTRGVAVMTVETEGETTALNMKWLGTFRKQPDGSWKVTAVAYC